MAGRRSVLTSADCLGGATNEPLRELFEACKTGDLVRVKKLVNPKTVNARDTAGRKSTPLHFAAGKYCFYSLAFFYFGSFSSVFIFIPHITQCITVSFFYGL